MFKNLRERILSNEVLNKKIKRVIVLDSVDSTNAYAQSLDNPSDATVVISNNQTKGKGRDGREWKSFEEKNISLSIILNYPVLKDYVGLVSLLSANSVIESLQKFNVISKVKWPNDILIDSRKVSGILSEAVFKNNKAKFLVVGIGINVNCTTSDFYGDGFEYRLDPTSLLIENDYIFSREEILIKLLESFFKWFDEFKAKNFNKISEFWISNCEDIGKDVSIERDGIKLVGKIYGINNKGELIIKNDGEEYLINSGEILT